VAEEKEGGDEGGGGGYREQSRGEALAQLSSAQFSSAVVDHPILIRITFPPPTLSSPSPIPHAPRPTSPDVTPPICTSRAPNQLRPTLTTPPTLVTQLIFLAQWQWTPRLVIPFTPSFHICIRALSLESVGTRPCNCLYTLSNLIRGVVRVRSAQHPPTSSAPMSSPPAHRPAHQPHHPLSTM
jgi:hypothetical protein